MPILSDLVVNHNPAPSLVSMLHISAFLNMVFSSEFHLEIILARAVPTVLLNPYFYKSASRCTATCSHWWNFADNEWEVRVVWVPVEISIWQNAKCMLSNLLRELKVWRGGGCELRKSSSWELPILRRKFPKEFQHILVHHILFCPLGICNNQQDVCIFWYILLGLTFLQGLFLQSFPIS